MTTRERILQLAVAGIDGRHWYRDANRVIHQFCSDHAVDPARFTKVLAVTSPQVGVVRNLYLTVGWCCFGVRPNVFRSADVAFQRLIDSGYMMSSIKGPKTSRFAKALDGDPDVVVLDTHMGYALNVPAAQLRKVSVQAKADKRFGWVANQLDWSPAEVQAAVWSAQRRRAGHQPVGIERHHLDRAWSQHKSNNPF